MMNVFSLWDVLPDQTVSILVEASLPRVLGMYKEPLGNQFACDFFVISKFAAVIIVQGENSIPDRASGDHRSHP